MVRIATEPKMLSAIVPPLARMKLRTAQLADALGASYGETRNWSPAEHKYKKNHQGWDLDAAVGTPCFSIAFGTINAVGSSPMFGKYINLRFSARDRIFYAFYAHLSDNSKCAKDQQVGVGQQIGATGLTGTSAQGGPAHLHFEIRTTPTLFPPGLSGHVDPGDVLGYEYYVSS